MIRIQCKELLPACLARVTVPVSAEPHVFPIIEVLILNNMVDSKLAAEIQVISEVKFHHG